MPNDLMTPQGLLDEITVRERLWKPRHERMDYWFGMYLLYDMFQENKPLGERRFISNAPQSIVDTVHRVISRFPWQWWLAMDYYSKTSEESAKLYGDIERSLYGFVEDIDEDLTERGEMVSRKFTAYQALVRGMVAFKVHLTDKSERDTNIASAWYDARFVLPSYDSMGLHDVICKTPMLGAEVAAQYPKSVPDKVKPDQEVWKVEVWDKKQTGCALISGNGQSGVTWLYGPEDHHCFGDDGERAKNKLNKLPFVIQDINGLPMKQKPVSATTWRDPQGFNTPQELRGMLTNVNQSWRTTRTPIAERGRSILCSVERHIPQFNEAVASIWQHYSLDTFGTYFLRTRGGIVPNGVADVIGSGGIAAIDSADSIQQFRPMPTNQSGVEFLNIISQEKETGTISGVLQALGEFRSGFLQARMEQVALNAVEPFVFGQSICGTRMGQLIVDQISNGQLKDKISLRYTQEVGMGKTDNFYKIEFDPQMLKEAGRIVVKAEIEPALPVDMMERATIANMLVNGRRPLISRSTAQERVLRIPDPSGENEKIWNDMAETDPMVVMLEIAEALERVGKKDIAAVFRDRQSIALAMQLLQKMQIQQALGPGMNVDDLMSRMGGGGGGDNPGNPLGLGGSGGSDNPNRGQQLRPEIAPPETRDEGAVSNQNGQGAY